MKLITVSGSPSSGKTSVILRIIQKLQSKNFKIGVVKFDCISTLDNKLYENMGIDIKVGLSGGSCPDHFFVSNIEECVKWAISKEFDILISESAGLCNRCSPHISNVLAVCVISNLSGLNTPQKVGPMLKFADIVLITNGDIVSQAEREIFAFRVKQVNPRAFVMHVNGITGQGADIVGKLFENSDEIDLKADKYLRFTMPAFVCSYCLGQTRIGKEYQKGNIKKIKLE